MPPFSNLIRRQLLWVSDLTSLAVAFLLTGLAAPFLHRLMSQGGPLYAAWVQTLSPAPVAGNGFTPLNQFLWVFVSMVPATLIFTEMLGGYKPLKKQSPLGIVFNSALAPLIAVSFLSVAFFVLKTPGYSRIFVLSFAAVSGLALCLRRLLALALYKRRLKDGSQRQEVALVGQPHALESMLLRFAEQEVGSEYRVVGHFSIVAGQEPPRFLDGRELPLLGNVRQLGDVLVHKPIQNVVIALPAGDRDWLDGALSDCDYFRVTTYVLSEALLDVRLHDLHCCCHDVPFDLPAVKLATTDLESEPLVLKRLIDVFVSAILLILLAPLFLLIAIAIKLTTPNLSVFYPWRVVGYQGRRFTGYKFTTMFADADEKKAALADRNEMTGPVFKITDDPRATPLGRFLRKYSLNELPQLWSVLKGDMSLVGPRPAGPHELVRYELWHKRKLSILPGITCFWQVRGRNRISNFDDWVRMDLEYIQNWSLWLDFKILARTAWVVIRGTGC